MTQDKAQPIKRITSHEADLVSIYKLVYAVLKGADQSSLPPSAKNLDSLDSPETIQPAKAVAILKAMLGSTCEDKFEFEWCYQVKMPDGGSLSGFVSDQLKELSITYHDLFPYLCEHGWLKVEPL